MVKNKRLDTIIKWPGGKEKELPEILPNLTSFMDRYIEPFVGGGAVYFAIENPKMIINDKSEELISLYKLLKENNSIFFKRLDDIYEHWQKLEKIVEKNNRYLKSLYRNYSADEFSKLQMEDHLIEFVIKHIDEFNGFFSTSFNINIENFIKEIKQNLINKISRMKTIEKDKGKLPDEDLIKNIETAFKSAFYMHFRHLYNNIKKYSIDNEFATAIFYFIRENCYSSMFRYNRDGSFNVPYGGISYNRKDFNKKINYLKSEELKQHLNKTSIYSMDFEDFLYFIKPEKNDFIFLDPPYDTDFSTYTKNNFDRNDQKRLATYLIKKCKANFLLVIKNTDFIYSLYTGKSFNITSFNKKYLVSFQNRNDKRAEHLLIKNY